jgi:hypothetical protein
LIELESAPNQNRSARYVLVCYEWESPGFLTYPNADFSLSWMITMTIAATRMYRGLDDFLSSDTYDNHLFLSSLRSLHEKIHCSSHVPPITVVAESQTQGPGVASRANSARWDSGERAHNPQPLPDVIGDPT